MASTDTRERFGVRRVLVVVQVALSLVLVVGALLFVRTVRNLVTVDPGFRTDNVLVADFDVRSAHVPPANGRSPFERSAAGTACRDSRGRTAPRDVAIEPLSGSVWNDRVARRRRRARRAAERKPREPRVLQAAGHAVFLPGATSTTADVAGAPMVAVVNQAFAERF